MLERFAVALVCPLRALVAQRRVEADRVKGALDVIGIVALLEQRERDASRTATRFRERRLGQREGTSSPIVRTLRRLEQFDLACEDPHSDMVAVRRNVPPINPRHLRRLPHDVQAAHAEWAEAQLAEAPIAAARRRARRVAFTLLEQGDDPDHVERVLHAMGFHPALCHLAPL